MNAVNGVGSISMSQTGCSKSLGSSFTTSTPPLVSDLLVQYKFSLAPTTCYL